MTLHTDILTGRQMQMLRRLGPLFARGGFYLAGGTCLALRIGHRRSVDLDWFTGARFRDPLAFAQGLRQAGIAFTTDRIDVGSLLGRVSGVRVSLFEYAYPLLQRPTAWRETGSRLASLPDLAAMKLSALAQRGSKKDFVDLFALIEQGVSLRRMLGWYQQKYAVQDTAHLLYSLVYFEDADPERMPRMTWRADWRGIKQRIREWVRANAR